VTFTHHAHPATNRPSPLHGLHNLLRWGGRAVLLVRNPLAALVSWYRHLVAGVHSDTPLLQRPGPTPNISLATQTDSFHQFAQENLELWLQIIQVAWRV